MKRVLISRRLWGFRTFRISPPCILHTPDRESSLSIGVLSGSYRGFVGVLSEAIRIQFELQWTIMRLTQLFAFYTEDSVYLVIVPDIQHTVA